MRKTTVDIRIRAEYATPEDNMVKAIFSLESDSRNDNVC